MAFLTTIYDITAEPCDGYDRELFDAFWNGSDRGLEACLAFCDKCYRRGAPYWAERGKDERYVTSNFFLGVFQAISDGEPLEDALFDMSQIACECDL